MNETKTVPQKKQDEVTNIVKLLKSYPVICLVDIENLPSAQFQKIRHLLSKVALIKVSKKRLMKIAFEQVKQEVKGIQELEKLMKGMPALMFTKENPFKIYKEVMKNKSMAAAKPGQIAPSDLIIPAGPTPFPPGPVISELGAMGIKTEIKEGKVAIKEEKLIVKEGEVIDEKAAQLLAKMGIEPVEISLNILAVLENGIILQKDLLAVDSKAYINNIKQLAAEAFNLAVHIVYINNETVKPLLAKAYRDANALADSQDIVTSENIKRVLAKAEMQMNALKQKAKI